MTEPMDPAIIAQLASRIYQESLGGAEGHVPAEVTSAPILAEAAAPAAHVASWRSAASGQVPPGMPLPPPASITSTAMPKPPAPAPSLLPSPPASDAWDGLRAFIQEVRGGRQIQSWPGSTCVADDWRQKLAKAAQSVSAGQAWDVSAIRADFPVLHQQVNGRPLAWLDNAATTQKPRVVIDAMARFYERDNSNIHRAAHTLAARATDAYEGAREKIRQFLNAASTREIVFVRGTTEGINLVAQTFGRKFLQSGDEIVISHLEHHANIVPWQLVARERGAVIRVAPVNDRGELMIDEFQRLLGSRTKLVALTHASNSLGTILPIHELTALAKRHGARVLIDGAQSVAHLPVDLQSLGADFFVFSGHKVFGPTGIGAVYIREELQEMLPPWQGGGNMIRDVTFEETRFAEAPAKFEAGTPNIADAVGLGVALDYVRQRGLARIAQYEHELLEYATQRLRSIPTLRLIGEAREKVGVLSFVLRDWTPEQVGKALDHEGIAVRSGHHCAQPSLRRFGLEATVRPSLSLYNTRDEIDRLYEVVSSLVRRAPTRR